MFGETVTPWRPSARGPFPNPCVCRLVGAQFPDQLVGERRQHYGYDAFDFARHLEFSIKSLVANDVGRIASLPARELRILDTAALRHLAFAATNEREGSEIATQITSALLEKRIKIFFVTHLYEFAHGLFDRKCQAQFSCAPKGK
jgi:hypothetical protein